MGSCPRTQVRAFGDLAAGMAEGHAGSMYPSHAQLDS